MLRLTMRARVRVWLAVIEVAGFPLLVLAYIWKLQFGWPASWVLLVLWMLASFAGHRDTPKSLGWRVDNFWPATRAAGVAFGAFAAVLLGLGLLLGARQPPPTELFALRRLGLYFAFCLLQQVALQSFLMNRLMGLVANRGLAALLAGGSFGLVHWPNPVLVPVTFVGGTLMAWLYARHPNVLPLAAGQALLGALVWWAFPLECHHRLRVGPSYWRPL